ncbi:MAG TPA: hypothetical protein VIL77_07490, partial [Gaiellaceae bacterium]
MKGKGLAAAWFAVAAFVIASAPAAAGPTASHQALGRNASAEAARTLMRAMAAHEGRTSSYAESSAAREDAPPAPAAVRAMVVARPVSAPA